MLLYKTVVGSQDIFEYLLEQIDLLEVSFQLAKTDMERREALRRMRIFLEYADRAIPLDAFTLDSGTALPDAVTKFANLSLARRRIAS